MRNGDDAGFHYSREERLAKLRAAETAGFRKAKGPARLFGGNRGAAFLGGFLLLFGAIAGSGIVLAEKGQRSSLDARFDLGGGRTVQARWIEAGERRGVNLLFRNDSAKPWETGTVTLYLPAGVLPPLSGISLAPGESVSAFASAPAGASNLKGFQLHTEK
jgi:hypothetical protein